MGWVLREKIPKVDSSRCRGRMGGGRGGINWPRWCKEDQRSGRVAERNFFTSPRNDTFATEKKENLEKTSSVILSKPQVLVRGSALGWGVERAIVLSGKQSSRLQKLQLLSPRSFFFFPWQVLTLDPVGRFLAEIWRLRHGETRSLAPFLPLPKNLISESFLKQRRLFCRWIASEMVLF